MRCSPRATAVPAASSGNSCPHFTEINYAMPLSLTTVNIDAWNALDAATQQALLDAAAEMREASV